MLWEPFTCMGRSGGMQPLLPEPNALMLAELFEGGVGEREELRDG